MTLFGGKCKNCGKALGKCQQKYCSYKCGFEYRKKLKISKSDDPDKLFALHLEE